MSHVAIAGNGADSSRHEIRSDEVSDPISHYVDAVQAGGFVFVSGCAPLDKEGRLVGAGDVVEQTRQVFRNMSHVLDASKVSFGDIVKVTVYLTNVDDREAVDVVRREVFGATRPASTLIEISRLAIEGMVVEVDAIAQIP